MPVLQFLTNWSWLRPLDSLGDPRDGFSRSWPYLTDPAPSRQRLSQGRHTSAKAVNDLASGRLSSPNPDPGRLQGEVSGRKRIRVP